ncbi:hypothetical protein GCM10010497_30130 [Streptomyces cinereoruber]|uniref:Lipoprotein n=1 Tax=Streptomyces cinereoruber TaxID=67260 RepID=A0AAV4KKH4_9ACTN|nr:MULTISPECIES: hypothetical protein [Streptomyces]MBB4155894.1 hypothetical protein [Streptomyces cinereoruber]MBY8816987.1 hypothetical protein [Streptomyces cinereoruber]NIH64705.1 hypothetical protein [Streptomyces cinereoruber]GGR25841.1 hypothetical protein GCM10010497_30130 [Streptomyces cinereoruber]
MAEQGYGARRPAVFCLLALLLALTGLVGCAETGPGRATTREIQTLLDAHARALLARDEPAYRAALDPAYAPTALTVYRRLAAVPLDDWSYRVTGVERTGPDRVTARAELGHRLRGHDRRPVTGARVLDLTERNGRWYVTGERPAEGAPRQLWEQGDVAAVHGTRSLVLGAGRDRARLREIAAAADRAVPAVAGVWPEDWARRVVVLVPGSLDAMGQLLGAPGDSYRGIAAVTTGETKGGADAPADRVIVNPDAYGVLGDFGRQLVLTHETVHVATRTHTTPSTPIWLSEGFADWVAYRDADRTPAQAAPELRRAVQGGEPPVRLPEDADFSFGGDAESLARAYEGGWLACEMVAERWGEERLTAFYRAVGAHPGREGAVENALHDVLGTTPEEFTESWRTYVREQLG